MEELQTRHRKEQRDIQSQITQKKKQASKKTRKAVNDECERLEADLKLRHQSELAALIDPSTSSTTDTDPTSDPTLTPEDLDHLTLQTDSDPEPSNPPQTSQPTPSNPQQSQQTQQIKKPSRQKARLARRAAAQDALAAEAAAEASDLPDLKAGERARMLEAMTAHGLVEFEVRADGHCLYSAVADQLGQVGVGLRGGGGSGQSGGEEGGEGKGEAYRIVRRTAAEWIESHGDDFAPFLEEPLGEYVVKVRDTGEWGGQLELMALARSYAVDIWVLQDFGRLVKIEAGDGVAKDGKVLWLGYYKHGFGLGEHYNSLRKLKK